MDKICLSVDLAQANDYTALAMLAATWADESNVLERIACRHLERLPRGTPYPAQVARIAALMNRPELAGAVLAVDATGVGRPVVDSLRQAGLDPVAITITGGTEATATPDGWHVPKKDLVAALSLALQSGALKIARSLPEAETLAAELGNFQVKVTPAANEVYGAWREGTHDDLVLAVAIGIWLLLRERPARYDDLFYLP